VKDLKITDVGEIRRRKGFKDLLLFALIIDNKYTLLPEIYKVFGKKYLLKFLDVFGGSTISVPSHEDLLYTVKNVQIYLDAKFRVDGYPTFSEIAKKYGISKKEALEIYHEMGEAVKKSGILLDDNFDIPQGDDDICQGLEEILESQ